MKKRRILGFLLAGIVLALVGCAIGFEKLGNQERIDVPPTLDQNAEFDLIG